MKTQSYISNLKKMAVIAVTAIVMSTGMYAQPSPEKAMNDEMIALNRLSVVMDRTEESLRYNAPAPAESEEVAAALTRLDELTAATESAVGYKAPEVVESVVEMERLDEEVSELEASLQYKAPASDVNDLTYEEIAGLYSLVADNR